MNFTFTIPVESTDENLLPLAGMQPTVARVLRLRYRRIIALMLIFMNLERNVIYRCGMLSSDSQLCPAVGCCERDDEP